MFDWPVAWVLKPAEAKMGSADTGDCKFARKTNGRLVCGKHDTPLKLRRMIPVEAPTARDLGTRLQAFARYAAPTVFEGEDL